MSRIFDLRDATLEFDTRLTVFFSPQGRKDAKKAQRRDRISSSMGFFYGMESHEREGHVRLRGLVMKGCFSNFKQPDCYL
jgi:hypothetical protein